MFFLIDYVKVSSLGTGRLSSNSFVASYLWRLFPTWFSYHFTGLSYILFVLFAEWMTAMLFVWKRTLSWVNRLLYRWQNDKKIYNAFLIWCQVFTDALRTSHDFLSLLDGFYLEPKFDGERLQLHKKGMYRYYQSEMITKICIYYRWWDPMF